jgi:hypothetical protein
MASLTYTAISSLDGYVNDEEGNFAWAAPDPDVHSFVNDLERPTGTYLYGRRLYETMVYWETANLVDQPPELRAYTDCGGRPTRSCTPPPSAPCPAIELGSSATSTPRRSGS